MTILEFEMLLTKFDSLAKETKESLSTMLSLVSEGKVPSKSDVEIFDGSIGLLNDVYTSIVDASKQILPEEDLPKANSSVSAYASAVKENVVLVMQMKVQHAKQVLNDFLRVRSLVEAYTVAISPYQDKAKELLSALSSNNPEEVESAVEGIGLNELFLQALRCEDLDSDEGIAILEDVSEVFSRRVQLGLQGCKYYISDEELEDSFTVNERVNENQSEVLDAPSVSMEETQAVDAEIQNEKSALVNADLQAAGLVSEDEAAGEIKMEDEISFTSDNVLVDGVNDMHDIIMLPSTKKIKNSVPSASAFKKDILSMPRHVQAILPLFTNLAIMTAKQVHLIGVCMDCFDDSEDTLGDVSRTLELLTSKGYLAAYNLENEGHVYCLTKYGNACLQKNSILNGMCSFWSVSFGHYYMCGTDEIAQSLVVTELQEVDSLLGYMYDVRSHMLAEDYEKVKESIKHVEGGYQVGVFVDGAFLLCLAAIANSKPNGDYPLLYVEHIPEAYVDQTNIYVYKNGRVFSGTNSDDYETDETLLADSYAESSDSFDTIVNQPKSQNAEDRTSVILANPEPISIIENEDSKDNSIGRMIDSKVTPKDCEMYDLILSILEGVDSRSYNQHSGIIQAFMLAKTASLLDANVKCKRIYQQLLYATRIAPEDTRYTSENLSAIFLCENELESTMMLSAYMFGLLVPGMAYDYALKSQTEEFLRGYDSYFPHLNAIKPLFAKLSTIREVIATGFTEGVLSCIGSEAESERYVKELQGDANRLLKVSVPKARMKALPVLYNMCFGKSGDLYDCLEIISVNDVSKVDLVNMILEEYCDKENDSYTISDSKVSAKLNDFWYRANGQDSSFALGYVARQQALRQFNLRLQVLKSWAEHTSVIPGSKHDLPRLKTLRNEIIQLARKYREEVLNISVKGKNVIIWALYHIEQYLSAPSECLVGVFDEFALTGIFTLDANRRPIVWEEMSSVKYYEPWRNMLRHIVSPITSYEQAKAEILDGGEASDLFDNLRQLEIIDEISGEIVSASQEQLEVSLRSAKANAVRFDESLELAYTYNRISETEKENLAGMKKHYMDAFLANKDFGTWRQFLKALMSRIAELTESRKAELQRMLDARLATPNGADSSVLAEAQNLLERDLNFAVAEEYINRFDNGESSFSEELQFVLHDKDHFSEFISDKVFLPIYNECSRKLSGNFQIFAEDYLKKNFPADWTSRLKEDSIKLVKNWPSGRGNLVASQIFTLLSQFGFNVTSAEKIAGKREEMFRVSFQAAPRSMADYCHPISAFGTQMKSQMTITVLHGNIPAKQLVDTITGMGLGTMSIVILNYPLNLAVRRQIAEEFHKTTGDNPFILIDQVLAIHLAQHQITERLPALLKCTLPFTTYQPFVRDGGSTADEMFCGRARELATIKDPNGACVVYGGRQLGKTALLERAESLCFKPENRTFAVYCNILNCVTEVSMVQKIVEDVEKKTGIFLGECSTTKELTNSFERLFKNGTMDSMLLLLDETDKFLASIADQEYAQLQPLIDFKRSTQNKFKFVLAGLHNVCRAKNATERNGVFGQLGTPLCVKPLSPTDALQLLSRPLRYLGFQIDRYPHLETILTQTNYYPGILQFFGYMLVETLATHYGKYYRAVDGNPPYTLQNDQLGAVMNSADLNNSIRNKFRWSLELDERYFMVARCIAVLYYLSEESTNSWLGFSIDEIMEIATEYSIHCLENTRDNEYKNLLDEMVEMGILSKPDGERNLYRLRRSSFIDIIGSNFDAVDLDITKNNKEVITNVSY